MSLLRHAWVLAVAPVVHLAACGIVLESTDPSPSDADAGASSGQPGTSSGGGSSSSSSSGSSSSSSSGGASSSGGSSSGSSSGCVPRTCAELGRTCGVADDTCGNALDCGGCNGIETCSGGLCVCPDLPFNVCTNKCGTMTNECGNSIDCGLANCTADQACSNTNTCVCAPVPASACNGVACGPVTNACGSSRDCPNTCAPGETCSGNVCASCVAEATNVTCAKTIENGRKVCGMVKNNCGTEVDCGMACSQQRTCQDCDANGPETAMCCR